MSRSVWAWLESFAAVRVGRRVGERSGREVRVDLAGWLSFGGFSATRCLVVLMMAGLLWMGAVVAPAWAVSAAGWSGQVSGGRRVAPVGGVVLAVGAGCGGGSRRVRGLQRRLVGAGFSPGRVDGCYGSRTEGAVARFQAARGLRVDGMAGPFTFAVLLGRSVVLYPGAGYTAGGSVRVRWLQRRLSEVGFSPGVIDGRYGPRTVGAVARFQAVYGLGVDGIAGPRTLAGLKGAVVVRRRGAHGAAGPRARVRGSSRASQPPASARERVVRPVRPARAGGASGLSSMVWLVLVAVLGLAMVGVGAWLVGRRRGVDGALPALGVVDVRGRSAGADGVAPGARSAESAARRWLTGEYPDSRVAEAGCRGVDERGGAGAAGDLGLLVGRRWNVAGGEAVDSRAGECGDAAGVFGRGLLLERQGRLDAALAAYERARRLGDPEIAAGGDRDAW